jgi:hypothetical protein
MQNVHFTPILRTSVVGGQCAGKVSADDGQFAKSRG